MVDHRVYDRSPGAPCHPVKNAGQPHPPGYTARENKSFERLPKYNDYQKSADERSCDEHILLPGRR